MEEALKKITSEIASEFRAWLDAQETKDAIESIKSAGDTGTFEVVITTENVDRYGEVIKLDGWELNNYNNNPVVLWGHDYKQLPIGITTSIETRDGKMIAKGKFAAHDFAQTIRQLYDLGMMRATSVGFIEKEREGNLITKAELLEYSFVSIPANPYALSTLVKSGISINELVTKGFLNPGKEKEADPPEPEPQPEPEPAPADPPVVEEKQMTVKAIEPIISTLKGIIVALEDLAVKGQEPERDDAPQESEEEKAFKEFSAKRKLLQDASTVLAEVLAEARQAIEAHKAS